MHDKSGDVNSIFGQTEGSTCTSNFLSEKPKK